jgi:hypothetical protein
MLVVAQMVETMQLHGPTVYKDRKTPPSVSESEIEDIAEVIRILDERGLYKRWQ